MHAILVSAAAALAASAFGSSKNCTQGPNTACDSQWTCCQTEYSNSNTGCCLLPDAVCCGSAPPPPVRTAGAHLEGEPLPSWGVGYCCPSGHKCVNITGGGIGCEASDWAAAASAASASAGSTTDSPGRASSSQDSPTPANFVCKPGASKPASRTQPNIAVLGDSVSIGYEPPTAAMLASKYFIQHTPWDTRGGGSGTSQYGLECLPALMRTSMSEHVNWDLVVFNFGLHDLDPSNSSQATYEQQLKDIAQQLRQYSARQLYALTTPYMPDKTKGIDIVQELNARAESVMKELGIPVVDLYTAVTDVCGKVYTDCSICRKSPCSYHYTPEGYQVIAKTLAPAIEAQMAG